MNILRSLHHVVIAAFGSLSLIATVASRAPLSPLGAPQAASDVSLTIVADRRTVRAGQIVTYTVTMTNLGPDDATSMDVAFALPDGMQGREDTCDLGISADGPFCEYSSLPSGASVVSTFAATPRTGMGLHARFVTVPASMLFENANAFDPDTSNNTATVKTRLVGRISNP